MFWLIETEEKLREFREKKFKKVFVEIISLNNKIHPTQNDISCLYIREIEDTKGYLISINHNDSLPIDIQFIYQLLQGYEEIFVRDKKEFLHYFILRQLSDLHFISPTDIQVLLPVYDHFYKQYSNIGNINSIIPIVKHYEYCELLFSQIKHIFNLEKPQYFNFYNNKVTLVFWWIEQEGIKVDPVLFKEHFGIEVDKTYTQFNLKTTTTRPSNSFNNINYAALDKKSGCRNAFIAENDFLLEIDISAYHPTLIAQMVGYEFDNDDIHQSFADMYGVDYQTSKELTFKQLYGGVFEEYKELEFFKRVDKYLEDLVNKEEIVCKSGYVFKNDGIKKQKLLNYILQNTETYYNVLILEEIIKILKDKNTKIIHYTYDSFLLDVDKSEKEVVKTILGVFDIYSFKTKMSWGTKYGSLESV
jgi:hypothetical protein